MPLTQDEIKTLASNPPPSAPPKKWRFSSAPEGNREIARLESILGLPPEKRTGLLNHVNARVAQLEQLVALNGFPSVAPAPQPEKPSVLSQYNAITDPIKRGEFYAANKAAYDAEFRSAQPKPAAPTNPFAPEDAMHLATYKQIENAADRISYYRLNARQIDRAIEAENFRTNH